MLNIRGRCYRAVMKLAHRFNWHYAPPIHPEGDTMLWCKWCGFREVVKRAGSQPALWGASHIEHPAYQQEQREKNILYRRLMDKASATPAHDPIKKQ